MSIDMTCNIGVWRVGISLLAQMRREDFGGGFVSEALASECDVLILDEPCSVLDCKNQAIIANVLQRLRLEHGRTVVFATHSPQHALEIATDVLLMYGKSSFAFGSTKVTMTEETSPGSMAWK